MAQKSVELILLRQWASYLTTPIFVAGPDGGLVYYNEAAEELLGRKFDDAGEMPLRDLTRIFEITDELGGALSPEDIPMGVALAEHRPAHRRLRFRALDGPWRVVDVTSFPIEGHDEQHLGAVAILWETQRE